MSCVGVDKSALCDEMTVGIYVKRLLSFTLSTRSCIFDCNSKPTNRDRRVFINRIGVYVRLLRRAVYTAVMPSSLLLFPSWWNGLIPFESCWLVPESFDFIFSLKNKKILFSQLTHLL